MTHFLITGGAGFIGSHLADTLLAGGDEVTALDDLSTGTLANIADARASASFRFVEGSIMDPDLLDHLVAQADHVVHLAAAVGVARIMEDPYGCFRINTQGTEYILDACLRHGKPVFIASTSELYGKNTQERLDEEADRVLGPPTVWRWSYSTAKAVDEFLALSLHSERDLEVRVARFFNTVGARQSPSYGMVLPSFAARAVRGEPIVIHGDGSQTRCFCHVSDTVRAVTQLLREGRAVGQVFNIGRPSEVSIRDLAELTARTASVVPDLTFIPYSKVYKGRGFEDMQRRFPDISKIQSLLGWSPEVSLEQMVTEAVEDARRSL